ncbi:hypothetical protein F5Y16DRAFT_389202 [Xylariaceae sp. FL0255]|nr:hypothetical protein F5Y16DRAFT_389202 [Xylariaceae sp. FL0255]
MSSQGVSKRICSQPKDRKRSRFGCGTCRARKVKCDQAFPICRTCSSSSRVCDGYGVWGGGGSNAVGLRRPREALFQAASPKPLYMPFLVANTVEKEHFDWFKHRALPKIPGSFNNDFWTTLLPQACLSERAILNAVLALSSIHRGDSKIPSRQSDGQAGSGPKCKDKTETFALQHYVQAIAHLQPYLSSRDRRSLRITLIACIVFVSTDFLRGHFETARNHVHSGLKLLAEMQHPASANGRDNQIEDAGKSYVNVGFGDSTDQWIAEVLSRLHIQISLYLPPTDHPQIYFHIPACHPRPQLFESHKTAWIELDRQFHIVLDLARRARQHQRDPLESPSLPAVMEKAQRSVLMDLEQWSVIYKASESVFVRGRSTEEIRAYHIIGIYHIMVTVMAHTCLHPNDESIFDKYTHLFLFLTEETERVRFSVGRPEEEMQLPENAMFDLPRSIIDVGCIPQLYYCALKCRVHNIRHRILALMRSMIHREGIWDARIVTAIAQRVVEVEEGDYYKSVETPMEDSWLKSTSILPESYRLRDVEFVYSGEPFDKVLLFCTGTQSSHKGKRVCIGQYDVISRSWQDSF